MNFGGRGGVGAQTSVNNRSKLFVFEISWFGYSRVVFFKKSYLAHIQVLISIKKKSFCFIFIPIINSAFFFSLGKGILQHEPSVSS